ncbi:MAG: transglycosylase domain-containing protein, partial [Patescibacteria group bacterium]
MVKTLPKKQPKDRSDTSLTNIIFKFLLFCINFFVSIGEGTRAAIIFPATLLKSIVTLPKQFKLPKFNFKLREKFQKPTTDTVDSPIASRISDKKRAKVAKLKRSRLKWPTFSLPKLKFVVTWPKIKFPNISGLFAGLKLPKITQKKTYTKAAVKRKKTRIVKEHTFVKYLVFLLKRVFGGLIFILVFIIKILKKILGFIGFLIRKPFEFLNTLFTAQLRFFLLGALICGIFFVTKELHQFVISLPSPKEIGKVNYSLATHLNDRNGKLLYEIYRDEKRTPIQISKLPKYVVQSSIAIEDKDFYQHKGVSLISGILRAGKETVFKGSLQGGSTITQQLVKTALLSPERTLARKAKEIILALWAEQMYSKNQILEMYLNQVPYGGAAYGIQEAAKTYFGKDAKDLTIAEAALLAGLPQAPSSYSPFVNPNLALERRNDVLLKLREQKYITESQFNAARETKLEIIRPEVSIKAPHFVFYVKSQLEKEFGTRLVEQGGLKVTTTIDLDVQNAVEQILQDELNKQKYLNVSNGAVLITKPSTGEIIAMAGSVDYFQEPYGAFNVTDAERQPGSSLKPLLYSLALQKGATAATGYNDSATTFVIPGAEPYKPSNYDGRYHGRVSMRTALANSYNVPAVQALYNVGIQSFVDYMQTLGISTWNDPGRYVL